ncbi:RHS repeat-associated core domain-containing protein [Streptomyces sp. NPDC055897]
MDTTVSKPRKPRATWPKPSSALVTLPANGATPLTSARSAAAAPVKAGDLPVTLESLPVGPFAPGKMPTAQLGLKDTAANVQILDHARAQKVGIDGLLLKVSPVGGPAGTANVTVDYSGFADAAGAGYGKRLHLVQLPSCALVTPEKSECRTPTQLVGHNDAEKQTVIADAAPLPGARSAGPAPKQSVAAEPMVLAATTGAAGPSGDFTASPLSAASTWSTALNTGSFAWSYSMSAPDVPTGLSPKLALSYSSGAIDGRTSNGNNQGSWAGDGFDIAPGFVERSYKPCGDDGIKTNGVEPGDMCWAYDNATISFDGHAGELIPVSPDEWRIKGDDNTKVVRLRDGARGNGDNDGEYFKATTANGTSYYFGYNRLPNWASGMKETKSVESVPVYGDDAGEPCHGDTFAASWCQQGRRWNLDLVVDARGNDMTYWYNQETNSYGRNLKDTDATPYVRAATLDHIEYGQQKADIYSATVKPMARVDFTTAERCLETETALCDPATIDTNRQYWYDTPWDQNCKTGTKCDKGRVSPTFWTRTRLAKVTTQTLQSDGTYKPVDEWSLHHKWGTADSDYQLLLDSVQHTALAGAIPVKLPATTLKYDAMIGRLDKDGDGRLPYYKQRLGTVTDESGGQLDVNYSQPACDWDHLPIPQSNATHCFPQQYQPTNEVPVTTEWFNKYVVDNIVATDRTGLSPNMVTRYTYLDGAAWAYDDDEGLTKEKLKTWSQWRGHAHVRVETGGTQSMSTQADHYFLRGMDGDRTDPSDKAKTRTVSVDDGEGTSLKDDEAWAGFEYRTETYDKPGGVVLSKAVNTPWKKETAKRVRDWGTTTANLTGISTARSYTSLDAGAGDKWRQTRSDTTFDGFGRPTAVEALGDTTVAGDDQCTRTTYADNTAAWILTGAVHTETVAGTCAATPDRDTRPDGTSAVISDTRIRYDGLAYGVAPTKGLPTLAETLKSRTGNTATYLDSATTYDTYGRALTSTAPASTSVFDPTNDAKAPTTTAASNARTTATVYTPTAGRTTKMTVTGPPATLGTAASAQTTTTYFEAFRSQPSVTVDTTGRRTDVVYDALGRTLKVWKPNRAKATQSPNLEFRYTNDDDTIQSVTSLSLNNTGSQDAAYTLYDGFGRIRQTQAPGQDGGRILTDTFYDERGQSVLTYAPYYATGAPGVSLFKVEDATGVETQTATQYDGLGRATKTSVLKGNGQGVPLSTTTLQYGGDRVTVTPPKGGTATTTLTDAAGHTTELRQYHAITETGPSGPYDSTSYSYDPSGQMTKLTGPTGNVWTWTYDQLGHQTKAVDPDSGTTTKTYNDRGELSSTTDGRGKTIVTTYDNLSRPLETHDGTATGPLLTSQTWDPAGSQGQAASSSRYVTMGGKSYQYKTTVNTYDALYRPTKSTLTVPSIPGQEGLAGDYASANTYNLDGTLQATSYPAAGSLPAEHVSYTYDKLHQPLTVGSDASTYLTNQIYSLTGKPLQATLNAGAKNTTITNEYEYGTQRLHSSRTDQQDVAGAARATAYTYDDAGNVTSLSDVSRTTTDRQCFQYDYLARLTQAFTPTDATCPDTPDGSKLGGPAPYWTSYSYNPDGTRKTETQHDPTGNSAADKTRAYTYPTSGAAHPHSLLSTTTQTGNTGTPVAETYDYDESGNTTGRHLNPDPTLSSDQALTWDLEGHLTSVADTVKKKSPNSTITTAKNTDYVYDASGSRLIAHTLDTANPAAENSTLYLGATELNYVKGAAKATATRYYALGSAMAVRTDDNKVTFQVTDHHGTADTSISATDGTLTQRRNAPFGQDRGTTPVNWPGTQGFIGGTKDTATGLTHLGAREYDPATGRFISVDPVLAAQDPQSLNGYAYSNNNPLTLSDPSGLRPAGACDGPCGGGTQEFWTGGPGAWQYTIISAPSKDNTYKVQHINFREPRHSRSFYVKVTPPKPKKPKEVVFHGYAMGSNSNYDPTVSDDWIERPPLSTWQKVVLGVLVTTGTLGAAAPVIAAVGPEITVACLVNLEGCAIAGAEALTGGASGGSMAAAGGGVAVGVTIAEEDASSAEGRAASAVEDLCSFTPDTPVLMGDGKTKPIGKIQVGDAVEAAAPETGEHQGPRRVDATLINHDDDLVDLTIRDANGNPQILHTTAKHPFWDATAHAWTPAGKLNPAHTLTTDKAEPIRLLSVVTVSGAANMYNLTVDGLHTYYVLAGNTPILVHNGGEPGPGQVYVWRSVTDPELADISKDRTWKSPNNAKWFSFTERGAAEYARRANAAFPQDGAYTMIRTTVNVADLPEGARMEYTADVIDGGFTLSDDQLKILGRPSIMTGMSTGVGCK